MTGAPLAGTLSFLLPDPPAAALLAVCLRPARAREAWRAWERGGGDLDDHRSLLPLLDEGARRGGVELPAAIGARLAGARLHETLRLAAIRALARDALDRLAGAGIEPLVIQDLALAETAYEDPALRHCHALDLLLPPGTVAGAAAALAGGGFEARPPTPGPWKEIVHASGFPVRLGEVPVPGFPASGEAARLEARSRPATIAGRPARVLAPEDALAIACGRAAVSAERRTLLWACDAARLVESGAELDWDGVVGAATGRGLELPLAAMLGWLSSELGVPVPAAAIEELERRSRDRPVEPVLDCVRADGRASPGALLRRAAGWRERWTVIRWTAFPSTDRLRRSYPDAPLPVLYLARPLRWAIRALTRRAGPPGPGRGDRARGAGTAAAHSGGRPGPAAGPPSASRRS